MTKCDACGQPYHESTGHRHTATCVLCGSCALDFSKWVVSHTKRGNSLPKEPGKKRRTLYFYDYTETSREKGGSCEPRYIKQTGL